MSGRPIPFVVAAPSGTGKTTVCHEVVKRDPELELSVSHTTRKRRPQETDGVDYHFVTAEEFLALQRRGAFIEFAEYNANNYGTSWEAIQQPLDRGHSVLLEIEVQGARQIRERRREACFVFLLPPDLDVLAERLRGRGTDDPATVARRLAIAERELEAAEIFDYAVVNDDLEQTVQAVLAIVAAERGGDPAEVRRRYGRARVLASWPEKAARRP